MASSRKKQDEKNLKTLRELASLPQNKYCFNCNQRGPTYVDITVGSFVCTKCSGMLRGLTPPHRVKSISMATFTTEEIELFKNHGNEYCRNVWLGLYEGKAPRGDARDEQNVRDLMVDMFERKKYYLDPSQVKNGYKSTTNKTKPLSSLVAFPKPIEIVESERKRPEANRNISTNGFAVNFDNAEIFSSNGNSSSNQESFANFEDNPVFNISSGVPTSAAFDVFNKTTTTTLSLAPPQDKYAALKDLDNALKSQNVVDWNSSGSNGSLYSSPTPTGSMYSSPSPQNSMFGSPSQGHFINSFPTSNQDNNSTFSNPFNNNGLSWGNPFKDPVKAKGFGQSHQPTVFPISTNGSGWGANPFKVGEPANPNNPFL